MEKCNIEWENPKTWEGCRSGGKKHFIALDYAPQKEESYCYDVVEYMSGQQRNGCFSDPLKLKEHIQKKFTDINLGAFHR